MPKGPVIVIVPVGVAHVGCVKETVGAAVKGIVITLLCKIIAPALVRALPYRDEPSSISIAPPETMLPLKAEKSPTVTAPVICQYTLDAIAPFIRKTFEYVSVSKAPSILIMNKALGSFCPSKVKFPANVAAAPVPVE